MDDILITTPDDEELHAEIVNAVLDMLAMEDFFLKIKQVFLPPTNSGLSRNQN